jgi:hypothetical protein
VTSRHAVADVEEDDSWWRDADRHSGRSSASQFGRTIVNFSDSLQKLLRQNVMRDLVDVRAGCCASRDLAMTLAMADSGAYTLRHTRADLFNA